MPCSAHSPLGLPVKILSQAVFKGHILPHLQALPCPLPVGLVLPAALRAPGPSCDSGFLEEAWEGQKDSPPPHPELRGGPLQRVTCCRPCARTQPCAFLLCPLASLGIVC